jgi:hypothetical protein
MADRTVEVDIVANDKTARGTDSAARNFDGLDRKVKRSSTDRNRSLEKDAKKSISIFEGLFGGLVKEGQKAGILASGASIEGFSSAFKAMPPEVKIGIAASLAAGAVLAAPAIVATVEAAVLAGVGAGGLAAGIVLAAKDPAVQAAYTNLGQRVEKRLEDSAKPFRSELIATAGIFGDSFDRVAPRIDRIFTSLSSTIKPLASGLAKGIEAAFPGIEKAVNASLPLLRELAHELPHIGQLVGDMFSAIAAGGPGAALAFRFILANVEGLILGITWLIQELGGAANGVAFLDQKAHELVATLTGNAPQAYAVKLNQASAAATAAGFTFNGMTVATYNTAEAANAANAAFSALFGQLMSVDQANLAVATGMANLRNTIKGNSKTLDENTASGRANVGAILGQIQALDQKRQADIAAGNGTKAATDKANAAYASQVASLRSVLIAMGLTASEVDKLIGKYNAIPRTITTTITTVYRQDGTPATGHSRYPGSTGFDSLDGWRPAQFSSGSGGAGQFAMAGAGGGGGRTVKPYEVSSNVDVSVSLDGEPFRKMAKKVTAEESDLRDWRARVGPR